MYFQMAAVTKILMRREKSIAPLLSLGDKQKTLETQNAHGDCDAVIAKAAAVVTRRLVLGTRGWACLVLICHHQQKRTFGGWERSRGGGIETNTWHRPRDMALEKAGEFECCSR